MTLTRTLFPCTLALALLSQPVAAAPPSVEEPASASRDPLQRLEALQQKVTDLEAELARRRAASEEHARLDELERKVAALLREIERLRLGDSAVEAKESAHGLGPAASKVYATRRGVSIGGYGELLYRRFSGPTTDRLDLLRAVLYTGYKFSDSVLLNSEIEFEHATTGEGAEEKGEVSVEFAYLDWMLHPEANLRAGLVLLPMGFLNELHEPTTFLGALRPETETRILPSTWREAGVGGFGERGHLSYRAYLVNGLRASRFSAHGLREGRQSGSNALAQNLAVAARLDYHPRLGTTLGASLFAGNAGQGEVGAGARTTIFDIHGELRERGFEARALYARATVGDAGAVNRALGLAGAESVGSRLEGGYVQLGYDLLAASGAGEASLIPFLRWEKTNTQARVPGGFASDPVNQRRLWTFGVAWRPLTQIVVKADFVDVHDGAGGGENQVNASLGWIF